MDKSASSERRVHQLRQQLAPKTSSQQPALELAPCAVHHRSLPRFDVTFMEHYLETDRGLKNEVYDLFKQHPELLYAVEEGMTKGEGSTRAAGLQMGSSNVSLLVALAEQHRQFVRKQLQVILSSGYSPMSFFMKDYRKYFYMAELLALVDLSLVSGAY